MKHCLIIKLTLLLFVFSKVKSSNWNYEDLGPDVWSDQYPMCKGNNQSPINIRTKCTVEEKFSKIQLSSAHQTSIEFRLRNNGHTITGQALTNDALTLDGLNLIGQYKFDSFHIHWGPNYRSGSEHQINGQKYPGECHFVYRNAEANRSAVLAFFMKIIDRNESSLTQNRGQFEQWKSYFDVAHQLAHENDNQTLVLNPSLLMGQNFEDFWRYNGSLTTPPCTENVIWTIFRNEIIIVSPELDEFRHDIFFESYRGPRPLYNRKVYRSFSENIISPIPDENCCLNSSSEMVANLNLVLIFLLFFGLF